MAVEKITPQLVKKGKGKKRPGYRGPGEYQGGRGYGGSKSSKGGDKGTGGSKGNLGGGGGGQNTSYRRYSPPTKKTYTSKTIDSKPVTGKDYRDSRNDFVNTLNRNNQIAAERAGTRFTPYQGGARMQRSNSGLGSLVKFLTGLAIPGAGFLLNQGGKFKEGLMNLNDSIQNSDFGRSTSLMDYLDMKKFGGYNEREMARRINMDEAKNLQARIDGGEFGGFGIQTPKAKPTFSDPFANTVGTTTKVNAPASDAVSSYSYGTADAAIPGVETNPSYINEFLNKPRNPKASGDIFSRLYNPEQIADLEAKYGNEYGITNTSTGKSSDARHMAAMNNLSNSLSPGIVPDFIGDTGAFLAGLINEVPALGRGLNKQNLGEIGEDIAANFRGSFLTPNKTTAEQIYGDVFEGSVPARTASVPTYGTAAAGEMLPTTTEDITVDGGLLNNGSFMESQINPRVIAAENAYYNQGKMPPEFLGDRLRMNMELGNARGFMGPGFAQGGLASMFTRRG